MNLLEVRGAHPRKELVTDMLPLENLTVGDLIRRTSEKFPGRTAVWYDGHTTTYAELNQESMNYAAAFASRGISKGAHVGLWMEPDTEALAAYYAVQRIGAVTVMLNTNLVSSEIRDLLERNDVEYLIAGKSYKTGRCLAEGMTDFLKLSGIKEIFALGEEALPGMTHLSSLAAGVSAADLEAAKKMEAEVRPEDTACILFTSGSTSTPKGVMSSHYSRVNGGIQQAGDLLCTENDKFCVSMPIFHCFCISVNIMAALAVGGCVCFPVDRHILSILDAIEQCKCTVLNSVPTMFHAMLARNRSEKRDLSSLRIGFIGGAGYPPEEFIRIDETLGPQFTLMSSLGQTECTAGLTTCYQDDSMEVRSTTVGHFMNHVDGCIKDIVHGTHLPPGEMGEICVRGYLNMQGYYKLPELTAETIDSEGYVHTGDLGTLDKNGNITLSGRLKELIIRGGENISPGELETVLSRMDGVETCKVVGVPDPHYGEEICACIIPSAGISLSEDAIREFMAKDLAAFKIPKYICFFESLPVTATGKIKPSAVKKLAAETLGLVPGKKKRTGSGTAAPSSFQPVKTKRASEMIYEQIRDQIRRRELLPGDRLPGERELMQVFRRSRPTVREALRMLERNGFIRTTPGSGGSVIQEMDESSIEQIMEDAVHGSMIDLADIAEYRAACETAVAGWAAERRTAKDLEAIEEVLDQMKRSVDNDDVFIHLDPVFHKLIAEAARNKVAALMNKSLASINLLFLEEKMASMEDAAKKKMCRRIYAQHMDVFDAIKNRQPEEARNAMAIHIRGFRQDLNPDTEFV